ncbi:MAG: malto-oligosyltrehalose synthase [Alkalispirochaetaceae bacterium]
MSSENEIVESAGPPPYPRATMRLQFHEGFTFEEAKTLVPYMADLGISHVYASPLLQARPGSTHGYDIVDHNTINREIGDRTSLQEFVDALHARGMGLILDFVPNHMGVGYADNDWWLHVLEWGEASPYAQFFDIDWRPAEESLRGKVLLPVLGERYGAVLEGGELLLRFLPREGAFSVFYYEHRFPISPHHYAELLRKGAELVPRAEPSLRPLIREFGNLSKKPRGRKHRSGALKRAEELKGALSRLAASEADVAAACEAACSHYNGEPGEPRSFDELHRLLDAQAYRASYWRLAANEINYRRFFDINDLAGIRVEEPEVMSITHHLIYQLMQDRVIQGLRLDHIDGLRDPKGYLERLQEAAGFRTLGAGRVQGAPGYETPLDQPFYVVVEKILAHHEQLREDWPVSGTTGYEFLAQVGELLTSPTSEESLDRIYREFLGEAEEFGTLVQECKYRVMNETLLSELNVLGNQFNRLAKKSRKTRDFSRGGLRRALYEIAARFPVYRTYVDEAGCSEEDRRYIDWAVAQAKKASTMADRTVFDFVHSVLTTEIVDELPRSFRRSDVTSLAMRFQQFTAPVTAKSVEDTAFYRYHRLVSRNEVGGDPERLYASPQAFHIANRNRLSRFPFSMIASATHDHKRGEDVRARLNVISELPGEWEQLIRRIEELSELYLTETEEEPAPSKNDRYLIYQTILGTWPLELGPPDYQGLGEYTERLVGYLTKALRESKVHTSWTNVDEEYERAAEHYLRSLLNPKGSTVILRTFHEGAETLFLPGVVNSLTQTLLKLTVPGVPDIYRGTELWDFTLVDPDNRRPVDFDRRREYLNGIQSGRFEPGELLADWRSGAIKEYVIYKALSYRKAHPDTFASGAYEPLEATGTEAERLVAFRRGEECLVVVPRLVAPLLSDAETPLPRGWEETRIEVPGGGERYREIFTGRTVEARDGALVVRELLSEFPLALLELL